MALATLPLERGAISSPGLGPRPGRPNTLNQRFRSRGVPNPAQPWVLGGQGASTPEHSQRANGVRRGVIPFNVLTHGG